MRVDRNDDLAVVHVTKRLPILATATGRPPLGTAVMAVGSPLGLGGSLSIGVVSGFRSLDGSDYMSQLRSALATAAARSSTPKGT